MNLVLFSFQKKGIKNLLLNPDLNQNKKLKLLSKEHESKNIHEFHVNDNDRFSKIAQDWPLKVTMVLVTFDPKFLATFKKYLCNMNDAMKESQILH